eukprot:TRINITY_DN10771_c0_g1_i5.p1 TRINITY_DN10771_c0_g1~~TRINITY_DN10771_c0_g1_i5.p1  ORF type:complete len:856 (+),score=278.96 TRINITY_DN10771_c0_g1_i5:62-2629(+)
MAVSAAAAKFGGAPIGSGGGKGGRKARSYDLANTNIGMLGTDLEKAVRQAAAETEDAWKEAGKKPGLQIWRIEKFQVVAWPKKKYGQFYSGDSYIILNTFRKGGVGALKWDVHFWIGKDSSQDEYGTAAYKTVELDDYLGGLPTQYREVQDKESRKFKQLFKRLIYLDGGIDTGFNHVEKEVHRNRLLHVKGRMHVVVREVPISANSLNSGDSFIFDGGNRILIWNGKDAAPMEKAKAANVAQALDDEREGAPTKEVFAEGEGNLREWWQALGGEGPVKSAAEGGNDEAIKLSDKRLLRVSDATGKIKMDVVAQGPQIARNLVDSNDAYILDDGYEVMVWIGKGASRAERKNALGFAVEYLKNYNRDLDTPISRIMDGGENETFEAAFEEGVLSEARPGDGSNAKFSANISKFGGHSKAVASSMMGDYKGSGGPGVAADLDAYYNEQGVDPADWKGRSKPQSSYAQELQAAKAGAYSAESGWVSGMTDEQRAARDARVSQLERDHKNGKYASAGAAGMAESGGRRGLEEDFSPTIRPTNKFKPDEDAKAVRKAIKGWGTHEKTLIRIFGRRTQEERNAIRSEYSRQFERDLIYDLDNDTGGNFARTLKALARKAPERDAHWLYKAMKGMGADNEMLIDIICTKSPGHLRQVADIYSEVSDGRSLADDITGNCSGHYRKLLLALVKGNRVISETVDQAAAAADAQALYKAGEKRWGTNEQVFIDVLTTRSYAQIAQICQEYSKICKHDLRESIKREMGGNLKRGLQTIVDVVRDPMDFYTTKIYESTKGMGTANKHLIELLIERSEVDMGAIKELFEQKYGKTLMQVFDEEHAIRWNYKRLLLAIIDEGNAKELNE